MVIHGNARLAVAAVLSAERLLVQALEAEPLLNLRCRLRGVVASCHRLFIWSGHLDLL